MGSVFGDRFKISVFGESHGPAIGVVLDGLPPGIRIDFDRIEAEMARRRAKSRAYSTKRHEKDKVEILSGLYNGFTTGTPLCGIIRNEDTRPVDYREMERLLRPGHADYSGYIRYKGYNDIRGSGHFSGRLTAPIVFAGAIASQILETQQIYIGSHIASIYDRKDTGFDKANITKEQLLALREMELPVIDQSIADEYIDVIENARKNLNSVGGIIETAIIGLPAGIGSPIFDNVEAKLSQALFSVPAVKGVEFGEGFNITTMYGSEANDSFYTDGTVIRTRSNNNGGINGGITNGMPVTLRVAIKPTSSISLEQETVDIKSWENTTIRIKGRHDTCIVPRAVPVVEAACAVAVLDLIICQFGLESLSGGEL